MRVLITGGAGFLGKKLARTLLARGELMGRPIEALTLLDITRAEGLPDDRRVRPVVGELARRGALFELASGGFDAIYHLAAVVSSGAEADFDLGYEVNLDGTRHLLEAARHLGERPRFVFASSCAAYGPDVPEVVSDQTHLSPQGSYGVQKAIGELLVSDYSRKGFIDGRSLRLPTICVRPGRPNKAASSFASGIIREPLNGEASVCPVSERQPLFLMSPNTVIDGFVRAMELDEDGFVGKRSLVLPGITATVAEMLESLKSVAGERVAARVSMQRDEAIARIVGSWPAYFSPERSRQLGFKSDPDVAALIRQHIEDERGGRVVE